MKNAGSEQGMIQNPDLFWAEYGSGISGGVQDESLISGPCWMKNERNCRNTIDSAKTKRDIDVPYLIDYTANHYLHLFSFSLHESYNNHD